MGCKHCIDPDGENCFPFYALRPHSHDIRGRAYFIGSTVVDYDEPLPSNFEIDPENPDFGTYTHCPKCGDYAGNKNYDNHLNRNGVK